MENCFKLRKFLDDYIEEAISYELYCELLDLIDSIEEEIWDLTLIQGEKYE